MTDLPITHHFRPCDNGYAYGTPDVIDAFEQNLVGHRIVELEDMAMILDDGTRLKFVTYPDCCACGWIDSFKAVENLEQATITAVTETQVNDAEDPDGIYEEHYLVTIFGGDRRLAELSHTTDHSNGYYTSAVQVEVTKGKPKYLDGGTKKAGEDR